jgi:hypothetical protein
MIYQEVSGVGIGIARRILEARLGMENKSCTVGSLVREMARMFISNLSYPGHLHKPLVHCPIYMFGSRLSA